MDATFEKSPSFAIARRYAGLLPAPSALFSSAIRTVRSAEASLQGGDISAIKDLAISSTSFLVGMSPTIKAAMYQAALDLHPDTVPPAAELTPKKLAGVFDARELTAILGLVYLTRHIRKRVDLKEWERYERKLLTHMEVGAIVGRTVRHIGAGNGFLIGGIRFLSFLLFSVADLKKFQELRRLLEKEGKLFDLAAERNTFGCTHLEIAAALTQSLGYGVVASMGLMRENVDGLEEEAPQTEQLLCWHVARGLAEIFHQTGEAPKVDESSDMYLPEEEASALAKQCWSVLRDGSTYRWLTVTREAIPEDARKALDIMPARKSTGGVEELEEGDESSV